jgi:hypothetical protein
VPFPFVFIGMLAFFWVAHWAFVGYVRAIAASECLRVMKEIDDGVAAATGRK